MCFDAGNLPAEARQKLTPLDRDGDGLIVNFAIPTEPTLHWTPASCQKSANFYDPHLHLAEQVPIDITDNHLAEQIQFQTNLFFRSYLDPLSDIRFDLYGIPSSKVNSGNMIAHVGDQLPGLIDELRQHGFLNRPLSRRMILILRDGSQMMDDQEVGGYASACTSTPVATVAYSRENGRSFLHEIVHTYINFFDHTIPRWLNEGLAEYVEHYDSSRHPRLRETFPPFEEGQWSKALSDLTWGTLPAHLSGKRESYRIAHAFFLFLEDVYSHDTIVHCVDALPRLHSVEEALEQATGQSLEELERQFHGWLRRWVSYKRNENGVVHELYNGQSDLTRVYVVSPSGLPSLAVSRAFFTVHHRLPSVVERLGLAGVHQAVSYQIELDDQRQTSINWSGGIVTMTLPHSLMEGKAGGLDSIAIDMGLAEAAAPPTVSPVFASTYLVFRGTTPLFEIGDVFADVDVAPFVESSRAIMQLFDERGPLPHERTMAGLFWIYVAEKHGRDVAERLWHDMTKMNAGKAALSILGDSFQTDFGLWLAKTALLQGGTARTTVMQVIRKRAEEVGSILARRHPLPSSAGDIEAWLTQPDVLQLLDESHTGALPSGWVPFLQQEGLFSAFVDHVFTSIREDLSRRCLTCAEERLRLDMGAGLFFSGDEADMTLSSRLRWHLSDIPRRATRGSWDVVAGVETLLAEHNNTDVGASLAFAHVWRLSSLFGVGLEAGGAYTFESEVPQVAYGGHLTANTENGFALGLQSQLRHAFHGFVPEEDPDISGSLLFSIPVW
ncbi:MAG: hypothetical protein HY465_05120 [Deltaproteobacteria bacterium]|nr:hypothetical protein [Deltaproteobacteria bacterium]